MSFLFLSCALCCFFLHLVLIPGVICFPLPSSFLKDRSQKVSTGSLAGKKGHLCGLPPCWPLLRVYAVLPAKKLCWTQSRFASKFSGRQRKWAFWLPGGPWCLPLCAVLPHMPVLLAATPSNLVWRGSSAEGHIDQESLPAWDGSSLGWASGAAG